MNDPRPAFLFHVRDFWTSEAVELMSFEEVGIYVFLLSRQWETGSIPADANALRTLCRRNATDLDAALRTVLRCFDDVGNGRLQNRRLEFERARLDEKSGKARGSAKARWDAFKANGGAKKADPMRTHSERNADAERTQCDGNASEGKGREGNTREEKNPRAPRASKAKRDGGTESTRHWDAEWERTRPSGWVWQTKDFAALGKCLDHASGSHQEVCRRITILLESTDAFHLKSASPGLLLSQWNNLGFNVLPPSKASGGVNEIERQLDAYLRKTGEVAS